LYHLARFFFSLF